MVDIGNGDGDAGQTAKAATAGGSQHSTQHAKRRTGRTASVITLAMALEILQQALWEFQNAGGRLALEYLPNYHATLILLQDTLYCPQCGHLSLGNTCQHCHPRAESPDSTVSYRRV